MSDDKIDLKDLNIEQAGNPCKICGKSTSNKEQICQICIDQYLPKLKKFLEDHPDIIQNGYLGVIFHKDLPVPRSVVYELSEAKLIEFRK
jgi:hypothetical protein